MTHAFQLAWEHRDIMELAYEKGEATDSCVDPIIGPQHFMPAVTIVTLLHKQPASSLACRDNLGHMQAASIKHKKRQGAVTDDDLT